MIAVVFRTIESFSSPSKKSAPFVPYISIFDVFQPIATLEITIEAYKLFSNSNFPITNSSDDTFLSI